MAVAFYQDLCRDRPRRFAFYSTPHYTIPTRRALHAHTPPSADRTTFTLHLPRFLCGLLPLYTPTATATAYAFELPRTFSCRDLFGLCRSLSYRQTFKRRHYRLYVSHTAFCFYAGRCRLRDGAYLRTFPAAPGDFHLFVAFQTACLPTLPTHANMRLAFYRFRGFGLLVDADVNRGRTGLLFTFYLDLGVMIAGSTAVLRVAYTPHTPSPAIRANPPSSTDERALNHSRAVPDWIYRFSDVTGLFGRAGWDTTTPRVSPGHLGLDGGVTQAGWRPWCLGLNDGSPRPAPPPPPCVLDLF